MNKSLRKLLYNTLLATASFLAFIAGIATPVYAGGFTVNNGTVTFNNSEVTVTGSISISGVITVNSSDISLDGSWSNSGIFNSDSSTVTFYGTSVSTISGNSTFYNFKCITANKQFDFEAGTNQTINNTLTLTGTSGNEIRLRSTVSDSKWYITFPNGAQIVNYVDVKDSDANTDTATGHDSIDSGNNNSYWILDTTKPSTIINLDGTPGSSVGRINLTWTAPGDDGAVGTAVVYYIKYSSVAGASPAMSVAKFNGAESVSVFSPIPTPSGSGSPESMLVTGLEEGVTYYFAIISEDDIPNTSDLSNGATIWAQRGVPSAIDTLQSTQGGFVGEIDLSWQAPGDDGDTGILNGEYRIDYATYTKSWAYTDYQVSIATTGVNPDDNQDYTVTGLDEGTTYYFSVWTRDDIYNWSNGSNVDSTWAQRQSPAAITSLVAYTGSSVEEIDLSWSAPGDDGTNGTITSGEYRIDYATYSKSWAYTDYELSISTSNLDLWEQQGITVTGLAEGTTYYFIIWTADEVSNWSVDSNMANASAKRQSPDAIDDLSAIIGSGGGEIDISWSAPGDDGTIGVLNGNYRIAYATYVKVWTYTDYQVLVPTSNVNNDDAQYYTLEELIQGATYFIRIWTADEAGTVSTLSNGATTWSYTSADVTAPSAVSNLSAAAGTWGGQIDLNWNATGDDGAAGNISNGRYRIQYSTYAGVVWSKDNYDVEWTTDTIAGSAEYRLVDSLIEGVTYYLRIWTRDEVSNNWSSVSNGATTWAKGIIPGAITTLTAAQGTTDSQIGLSWQATGDDAGTGVLTGEYRLAYATYTKSWSYTDYQVSITTSNVNPGEFQYRMLDNLINGATYYIRLWVRDEITSHWSAISNGATTWAQLIRPDAIDDLTGTQGTNGGYIDLNWNAPGDDGAIGILTGEYRIAYATYTKVWSYSDYDVSISTASVNPDDNQYSTVVGLKEGATYYLRIWTADNEANWSVVSNGATIWAQREAPDAIDDLSAVTGINVDEVNLSWSAPGDDSAVGMLSGEYRIAYATYVKVWDSSDYDVSIATANVNPDDSQYSTVTGLNEGSTYYFRVWALDDAGNAGVISNGATTWAKRQAPDAIDNLAVSAGTNGGEADLSWTAPGDNGDTGVLSGEYRLAYATYTRSWAYSDYDLSIATASVNPDDSQYSTVTGLIEGATYYFRVWTLDEADTVSAISNGVTTWAKGILPDAIDDLAAVAGSNGSEIDLNWNAPGDDGAVGTLFGEYRLAYATYTKVWTYSDYDVSIATTDVTPDQSEAVTLTGLKEGSTYYIRIWTRDEVEVNWSAVSNGATTWAKREAPSAVNSLSAQTGVLGGRVDLSWTAPGDDSLNGNLEGYYRIAYATYTKSWAVSDYELEISTITVPLSSQAYTISGLTYGATYYFRLWSGDDVLNWSVVSNGATDWAQDNNAPNSPASPLCEGQTNPEDISAQNPRFTWTFSDNDVVDTQKAYKILVAASQATLDTNTGDMWDSGKVESSDSQDVEYAGSALASETTYYWKVINWDLSDDSGTYCATQWFTTQDGTPPVFITDSFESQNNDTIWINESGWNNNLSPVCHVQVQDISSGIRISTAGVELSSDGDTIALWHLSEGLGSATTADSSGNNHTGNISDQANMWTASGKFGNALFFDGIDDLIDPVDDVIAVGLTQLTFEAWINITDNSGHRSVIADGGGSRGFWLETNGGSDLISFGVRDATDGMDEITYSTSVLNTGQWHYLAGVWDGSGSPKTLKLYLDGIEIASKTTTMASVADPGNEMRIGGGTDNHPLSKTGSDYWFSGYIDEIRISGIARSDSEILANYKSPLYRYSTDGGSNWDIEWSTVSCSGSTGSTAVSTMTTPSIPFNQESTDNNVVKFMMADVAGNMATSSEYVVKIDTIGPSAITSLSASQGTYGGEIGLNWTAGGDNDTEGTAVSYDIRYASYTPFNWSTATQFVGEPNPLSLGTPQSSTVTGLQEGTTYYFYMKVTDKAYNVSNLSIGTTDWAQRQAPSAVDDLSVAQGTNGGYIDLSWTAPGDDGDNGILTGEYRIDYATYSKSWAYDVYQVLISTSSVNPDEAQYQTITGLTEGVTYYFTIWTADEVQNRSSVSNEDSNWAQREAPEAVADISAVTGTNVKEIDLNWSAPGDDGNTGVLNGEYRIAYATYTTNWDYNVYEISITTSNVNPDDNQYRTVTGLDEGATYYFRIWTMDDTGNWSNISTGATTWAQREEPAAIVDLTATQGTYGEEINLSWSAPGNNGSNGSFDGEYRIDYATYTKSWTYTVYQVSIDTTGVNPDDNQYYTVTGLDEGTTYYFSVWTRDDIYNWSNGSNVDSTWAQRQSPAAITSLAAYTGSLVEEINLAWSAPGDDGTNGTITTGEYRIDYATYSKSWAYTDYELSISTSNLALWEGQAITVTGLAEGTTYYFVIWTADEVSNWGADSNAANAYAKRQAPDAVDDLNAVVGSAGGEIDLSWSAPGDDGTIGVLNGNYRIAYATYVKVLTYTDYQVLVPTSNVNNDDAQFYTLEELIQGATYFIRIWTADEANTVSTLSNGATAWAFESADVTAPSAVSNLSAAAGPWGGEIDLNWNATGDDGAAGNIENGRYRIQYSTYTGVVWSKDNYDIEWTTDTTAGSAEYQLVDSLIEGVTYYLRIWSRDEVSNNWSTVSNGATTWAKSIIPGAITTLTAGQGVTDSQIDLSWQATGDDAGTGVLSGQYRIDYATYTKSWDYSDYQVSITTSDVNPGEFQYRTLDSLINGATYYIRLWARDEITSHWSAVSNGATTWAQLIRPDAIDDLAGTQGTNGGYIDLNWNAPGDDGAIGVLTGEYRIAYATYTKAWNYNDYDVSIATANINPDDNQYNTVVGLKEGATYYLRIWTADNEANWSAVSNGATIWAQREAPDAIDDLSAVTGINVDEANLSWSAPGDDSAAGTLSGEYRIAYATYTKVWASGDYDVLIATSNVNPDDNQYSVVTGLNEGATYYFRVWALDDAGNTGSVSNGATTWAKRQAPEAIDDLAVSAGTNSGEADLSWSAPGDDGANGVLSGEYRIAYATYTKAWSYSDYDLLIATSSVTPDDNQYRVVTGLIEGATYYFRVWTLDEAGTVSMISNGATTWAKGIVPDAVDDLAAVTGSNGSEIDLSWSAPGDDGANGTFSGEYRIAYATYTKAWAYNDYDVSIATTNVNPDQSESRTLTGLTEGSTYYIRIWTRDEVEVNWSVVSNGATTWARREAPSAVNDLSAQTGVLGGRINLNWTAPGDDSLNGNLEGYYRIDYATYTKSWVVNDYELEISTSAVPLSNQAYTVSGLTYGATYYFRLWSGDDVLNWSAVSNGTTKWAQDNNAPNLPLNLLCEGQTNPQYITDPTPEFSWTFSDNDSGDTQLAYRLLVAQSSTTLSTNTGDMWDSGMVVSVLSTNIQYSGSALIGDSTYYWKVVTWDVTGDSGSYCSAQNFTTLDATPPSFIVGTFETMSNDSVWISESNWNNSTTPSCHVEAQDTAKGVLIGSSELNADSDTLGLWHFSEGAGDTVYDSSSNGVNGTVSDAAGMWTVSGKFSDALDYDGGTDEVSYGDVVDKNLTQISLEAWVNITANDGHRSIMADGDENQGYWLDTNDNSDVISFGIRNGNFSYDFISYSTSVLNTGQWYHIAGVWDGDSDPQSMKLYIDGVQVSSKTTTIDSIDDPTGNFRVGGGSTNHPKTKAGGYNFSGIIDEVRISETARSDIEIAAAYWSPQYKFSTDGGSTWDIDWSTTTCSGTSGSTAVEIISISSVPFNQSTASLNKIKFLIADIAGNVAGSSSYNVRIDSITPSAITDLSATPDSDAGEIEVSWTAPGDDNNSGTASEYDVRYTSYTPFIWATASEITDEPSPQIAGTIQSTTLTGLPEGSTYYFYIKTEDKASSWSGLSIGATSWAKRVSPAAINDLAAVTIGTEGTVILSWAAPGDDNWTGSISTGTYRIDYATYTKSWDYTDYRISISTNNVIPYSYQTRTVTSLTTETTWYFRIWTADEVNNWSDSSNDASDFVLVAPAPVVDLLATPQLNGDVLLNWTAPGDDLWTDPISTGTYRIDYSTYSKAWAYTDYQVSIATQNVNPVDSQFYTITGLDGGSTYYFRLWTADELLNWSDISNGTTCQVNTVLSIEISSATYDFGVITLSSSAVSLNSIDITNKGNITETFKLIIVSEPNGSWTSVTAASPGAEEYRFSGIFRTPAPVIADFSVEDSFSTATERTSSATALAKDADGDIQKGLNVPVSAVRKLWFKFEAPTATEITTTQGVPVRIIAIP